MPDDAVRAPGPQPRPLSEYERWEVTSRPDVSMTRAELSETGFSGAFTRITITLDARFPMGSTARAGADVLAEAICRAVNEAERAQALPQQNRT